MKTDAMRQDAEYLWSSADLIHRKGLPVTAEELRRIAARLTAANQALAEKDREIERLRGALEIWQDYADSELSRYDEECNAEEHGAMCPTCRNVGCIRLKFEATRAALSRIATEGK